MVTARSKSYDNVPRGIARRPRDWRLVIFEMVEGEPAPQRSRQDHPRPSVSHRTLSRLKHHCPSRNLLIRHRIVVLVQANIWIAGRFILYLFNSFYALGVRLSYFLSQSLAVLLALLAVVGNLRHPLSRLVLIIAAFTTLWSYLSVPMCFSLPAVVFAGGLAEHYFPTIEVPYNSPFEPFEVISPHTPRQDIELEEL